MPGEEGPVSFGDAVTKSIMRAEEALASGGDGTREVAALRRLLGPWCREDKEFKKAMERIESEIIRAERVSWPRPRRSWRNGPILEELVRVAKESNLLDIPVSRKRPHAGELMISAR